MEDTLQSRQSQREFAFNVIYSDFLKTMILKKKNKNFRNLFFKKLEILSLKIFKDEDEEYDFISKYGRGIWDHDQFEKTFNKEEMEIVKNIAEEYGAFSY